MAKLSKKEFLDVVMNVGGYDSRAAAARAVENTFEAIVKCLEDGNEVSIDKFGQFKTVDVKEKSGKVPGTDKTYTKPAHKAPKMTFSSALKKKISGL